MKAGARIAAAAAMLTVGACMDLATTPTAATSRPPAARTDASSSWHLLQCPSTTSQSATGLVSLLGGVVSLGNTQIAVPFGAILQSTLFEVDVPASPYMEVDVHAVGLTSFLFQRPASITIDYSRCGPDAIPPGAQLHAVYIDTQADTVLQDMGGVNDSTAHSITFSTGHLSGYAVAY